MIQLHDERVIRQPWQPQCFRRHREMHRPAGPAARPMRAETRGTLLEGIAKARRWLDEIASGAIGPEAIAVWAGCSSRQVAMTISTAFLAPDIVEATIAGRLPNGIGTRDLRDAPVLWARQRAMIGLDPAL